MDDLKQIAQSDFDALANAVIDPTQPDGAEPRAPEPAVEPLAAELEASTGIRLTPRATRNIEPPIEDEDAAPARNPIRPRTTTDKKGDPRLRILLLLLLLSVLGSIAIWTPAGLQQVTAGALGLLIEPDIQPTRAGAGPAPLVGQLDVNSTPSGAELIIDGESRGVTPMQLVLNAGRHELLFVSQLGNVRRTVRIHPGHRTLYSEAIFPGSLVVPRHGDAEVWIDGKEVDTGGELTLLPGSYQVNLVNQDNGSRTTHTVDIFPGQTTLLDPDAAEAD